MHQMRNHLIVQIAKRVNLVLARLMGGIQAGEEWSRAGDSKSFAFRGTNPGKRSSLWKCLYSSPMKSLDKPEAEEVRLCSAH